MVSVLQKPLQFRLIIGLFQTESGLTSIVTKIILQFPFISDKTRDFGLDLATVQAEKGESHGHSDSTASFPVFRK
jgi:hypothetical protein